MREIEQLAKAGFLVFSYDHTGCMASGGENCNGFAQSLGDLDACMEALKAEKALEGYSFSVMGHSWGGFSTMNIAALHPEITHVVSMSGFVSVEMIVDQTFGGPLRLFKGSILDLERQANPEFMDFNAAESLKNTDAKVLLIYSANDSVVHKNPHYDTLFSALKDRPNIRFRLEMGKDHSPNYTQDAVAYKTAFFNAFNEAVKKKKLTTPEEQDAFMARYDWRRMTAQDPSVWDAILTALK
jgi:pimeloyl-ACP methyl ester carboxylesterase